MSHPFGDLVRQHLHRKHGLSQAKLAAAILQDPSIIGKMCKGQRLRGRQARERVVAIIEWLRQQAALTTVSEANQLLAAAGMAPLREDDLAEGTLLRRLDSQTNLPHAQSTQSHSTQSHPAPAGRRTNLPALLTSFVGRTQELNEVAQLIAGHRLVTLTGAGGVGKTRLALEVAKSLAGTDQSRGISAFPDGIWVVELATLEEGDLSTSLIAQAIARLLKNPVHVGNMALDRVQALLADKQMLLVLDNCEHLVAACAEVSERLLHHCWRLRILATSREDLRISGEVVYPVLPLALTSPTESTPEEVLASPAIQLLVERMGTTMSIQNIEDAEVATLAYICRQLDGIPLALELAAPLKRRMALTEIASRLDSQMTLLTNSHRTAGPRHQTMHAALVWSYQLLGQDEQQLLARASVFVGGWTTESAQAICLDATLTAQIDTDNVASTLHQLSAKSLVLSETLHDDQRFHMLEPVRQFAQSQLIARGEQEAIARRHAHYFLALAEQMDAARDTPLEREWLERLEPERDNLRAVNRWAFAHNEAEFAQQFNGYLFAVWLYCSNLDEASYWLEGSLALAESPEKAERTPSARMAEAASLNTFGYAAAVRADFGRAQALFERELILRQEIGDSKEVAAALRGLSFTLMLSNNLDQAHGYGDQARAISHAEQDRWGIAWGLFDLGYETLVRGELSTAQAQLADALLQMQEQGINNGAFRAMLALGHIMRATGNNEQAYHHYSNALRLQQQMHYQHHIVDGLEGMAAIAATADGLVRAVQLFGAAHAHRQAFAIPRWDHQEAGYERDIASTRSRLEPEEWNRAWISGCAMTLEQAVEFALV